MAEHAVHGAAEADGEVVLGRERLGGGKHALHRIEQHRVGIGAAGIETKEEGQGRRAVLVSEAALGLSRLPAKESPGCSHRVCRSLWLWLCLRRTSGGAMEVHRQHHHRRRVIVAGIAGNVMEWYDFAIYGYFARTIGSLYFPADNKMATLLVTYGVFAVGFLMRPVGAVVFGYVGDRVGRGPALLWSVVAMALPTLGIGLLPSYATIGFAAPLLMVVFRLFQGLAVGGEYTASAVFLAETAEPGGRGLASAWAPFGAIAGILLGSAVGAVVLNGLAM